jgi:hypothetical protein
MVLQFGVGFAGFERELTYLYDQQVSHHEKYDQTHHLFPVEITRSISL